MIDSLVKRSGSDNVLWQGKILCVMYIKSDHYMIVYLFSKICSSASRSPMVDKDYKLNYILHYCASASLRFWSLSLYEHPIDTSYNWITLISCSYKQRTIKPNKIYFYFIIGFVAFNWYGPNTNLKHELSSYENLIKLRTLLLFA